MRSKPWTADDVCQELPNAFRVLPATPIFAPRHGLTRPALTGGRLGRRQLDPTILFNATTAVLGATSTERRHLLAWARIRGTGSNQEWAAYARANKSTMKSPSTFKRNRRAWCFLIAVELNRALCLSDGKDTDGLKVCA